MNAPTPPRPAVAHLQGINLIVATLAGIISITGGFYSLKSTVFSNGGLGSLQGVVRDAKIAKPLQLVSVEVQETEGIVLNKVKTNIEGYYEAKALKPGAYIVKFTAPLHRVETQTVKIEKGIASTIDIDLIPEEPKIQTPEPVPPPAKTSSWTEVGTQVLQDWIKKKASETSTRR